MEKHQETEEGYYSRNGDVLEWHWKEEPSEEKPPEKKPAAKRKPGRPKKAEDS